MTARPTALILTPRTPWPLDDGGRIVLWQAIDTAAREHDVVLVTFDTPAGLAHPEPDFVRAACRTVVRVPHRPAGPLAAALRGSFGRWPHTMVRFHSAEYAAAVRDAVRTFRPAFAVVNNLHLAVYADDLGDTPWVLREQNVEHLWMARYAATRRDPLTRAYALFQAGRLRRFEREAARRAAIVFAIQEEEARELRVLAPEARVEVVPIGIDFARYVAPRPVAPAVVLVVGSFAYAPNVEGLRRFVAEGAAELRRLAPAAILRVAGRGLAPALARELVAAGVEVVGAVPDMAPQFAAATVVLVPLWMGAGARVKIVEAAAAGVPVVSTPLGAEGLGLDPVQEIRIAEGPLELAREVAALVAAPAEARAMGARAHAFARERYALPAVAARTNLLCASIARRDPA